jgi:hypothetical protein
MRHYLIHLTRIGCGYWRWCYGHHCLVWLALRNALGLIAIATITHEGIISLIISRISSAVS